MDNHHYNTAPDQDLEQEKHNSRDYHRIAGAIRFLLENRSQAPNLESLADHINLSPHHCQRLFHRWAGITPKQLQQFITKEAVLERLRHSQSILETSLECGLSSPSRIHDLTLHWEAITPGQHRNLGKDLKISHGFIKTPFGEALLATTARGICHLGFTTNQADALETLRQRWPQAHFNSAPQAMSSLGIRLFQPHKQSEMPLHIWGTPFQHKVWEALIKIPEGLLSSYGDIAKAIQQPSASRAVGTAIGQNNLAVVIPCHRVIRQSGEVAGYRWGTERKQALLLKELCNYTF